MAEIQTKIFDIQIDSFIDRHLYTAPPFVSHARFNFAKMVDVSDHVLLF